MFGFTSKTTEKFAPLETGESNCEVREKYCVEVIVDIVGQLWHC